MIHGQDPAAIRRMTRYQALMTLEELNEDLKERIKLAGGEVKDEEEPRRLTIQDLGYHRPKK